MPEFVATKRYTCLLCGRHKFQRPGPHRCNGQFRKRKIRWMLVLTLEEQDA